MRIVPEPVRRRAVLYSTAVPVWRPRGQRWRAGSLTFSPQAEAPRGACHSDAGNAVARGIPVPAAWALQPPPDDAAPRLQHGRIGSAAQARTSTSGVAASSEPNEAENLQPNTLPQAFSQAVQVCVKAHPHPDASAPMRISRLLFKCGTGLQAYAAREHRRSKRPLPGAGPL